ncbi:MAG: hypothetical protein SNJ79_06010 [Sphingomonadaceae bacterium]
MARGRGTDRRGRSKRCGKFVMLPHKLMDSGAWRGLSAGGRCLLMEIARGYNGSNNGAIAWSCKALAQRLNASPTSVTKWLREAQKSGLLECVRRGAFQQKATLNGEGRASEWRLMWLKCDKTGDPPRTEVLRPHSTRANVPDLPEKKQEPRTAAASAGAWPHIDAYQILAPRKNISPSLDGNRTWHRAAMPDDDAVTETGVVR